MSEPLWNYIPLSEFVPPSPPDVADRGRAVRAWPWSRGRSGAVDDRGAPPVAAAHDRPDPALLDRVAPEPDWDEPASALETTVADWLGQSPGSPRVVGVVGPPGTGLTRTLFALVNRLGLPAFAAPPPRLVLEEGPAERAELLGPLEDEEDDQPIVIPRLERFYLRHHDGLDLIRDLLDRLAASPRRVLVGCDSWAWAYLGEAVHAEQVIGEPLTLAPFDAGRLARWLGRAPASARREVRILRAGDGAEVFPEDEEAGADDRAAGPLFRRIAAASRGIPCQAIGLWRRCLRARDPWADDARPAPTAVLPTLWAVPPSPDDLATLPVGMDGPTRFVLHAILLHGGLPPEYLRRLLPMSEAQVLGRLRMLRDAGLVEHSGAMLRVTPRSYAVVRRHLADEGFLVDAF